ncbi:hypothetical protein DL770_008959 [Monosporascus sp. CRB-9-2]|nr:hypothetical protein DL770_008959 [Monosporascus sp. CRB-9-2]
MQRLQPPVTARPKPATVDMDAEGCNICYAADGSETRLTTTSSDGMSILSSVRRLTPEEYSRMRNCLVDTRSCVKKDENRIRRLFRTFHRLESAGYFQLERNGEPAELRSLCGCPWLGGIVYNPENDAATSLGHKGRNNSTCVIEQPPPTIPTKIPPYEAPSASVPGFRPRLLHKTLHNRQAQSVNLALAAMAISILAYSPLISIL